MKSKNYPLCRRENLVVQEISGEVMIYDLDKNKAFCLNETSAMVWQLCDGKKSTTEIVELLNKKTNSEVNENLIWFALDQLNKEKLLVSELETPVEFIGKSRREIIKTIGISSMIALPIIASLVAPTAVQAAASACLSIPTCLCNIDNAPMNGDSCGNGNMDNCVMGCTCTRNTGMGACFLDGVMVFCPGVCS